MKHFAFTVILLAFVINLSGCGSNEPPVAVVFRGNPISSLPAVLTAEGSPYLAVDSLIIPAGASVVIEPGVELRFDTIADSLGRPVPLGMKVYGKLTAVGAPEAPITFTSGRVFPTRGDWDGVWMIDASDESRLEYCRFLFGAKYGRRYNYRETETGTDSTLYEYGGLTLFRSSPTVKRCWFLASGFHGVHIDSFSTPTIENCVFYDNAGHGVYVHWTAEPVLRYNIIVENDDYGVFCRQSSADRRASLNLSYNIVWSNFSGEYNGQAPVDLGRVSTVNGNLDSSDTQYNLRLNPAFADAEGWDFHPTSCSAAIDAGSDAGQQDADGTRPELGIFPYRYRRGEIRVRIPNLPRIGNRLDAAGSPYYMSCDIILPAGETLTIEPGVTVFVEGRYRFRAMGDIVAEGTANAPIQFLSASANPKKGDWLGISLPQGGGNESVFSYTTISHARWGIRISRRDAVIDHCNIANSDSVGIYCDDFSAPTITDCDLIDNSIAGILCQFTSSPLIQRNRITGGAGYGVYAREFSRPRISNNVIAGVGTNGVRLDNLSSAQIVNNTIALNGYFGLYCFNNSSPDVRNNIFYRNGTPLRGGVGILAERTSRPVIAWNNFYAHAVSAVNISSDTTRFDRDSNLLVDPVFMDAAGGNYHLRADSPCIDAGDPSISDTDGSRSDMGAYGGPGGGW